MPSRMSRAETFGLSALALLGTAGGSVFGALASEGAARGISATSSWVSYAQSFWSALRLSTDLSISGFFGAEALHGNARSRHVSAPRSPRRGLNVKLPRSRTTRRPVSSSGCGRGCHRCCTAWEDRRGVLRNSGSSADRKPDASNRGRCG
jgi:hypothetical protein